MTASHPDGNTPIEDEQRAGLRLAYISTRGELDAAEQTNVAAGLDWALGARAMRYPDLLSASSMLRLHKRMFGEVYSWAGTFRRRETSIGVDPRHIPSLMRQLCLNARFWVERAEWSPAEIAVRIHHELARVHAFPNGNGRHARAMADILLMRHYKRDALAWGRDVLTGLEADRGDYIQAMRAADAGDFAPIIDFACKGAPG